METQAKHTPTPWKMSETAPTSGNYEVHTEEDTIAYISGMTAPNSEENAEFIVKACNSHAGLVRQLGSAYTALLMNDGPERASMEYQALLIFCRGAIASARGESDEVVQNRCEHESIQRKLQNTCKPLTS